MTSSSKYVAFISYRHISRDTEVAKQVQHAIETYVLPKGLWLAVEIPAKGSGGKPLGQCFRDEDELEAAASLPDRITEALQSSSAMVVVCSPEACESAWMQREIETFIEAHGRDRVFCVLAAGDSHTCIPEILRYKMVQDIDGIERRIPAEPLAADFRPSAAEKRSDEKLRLIAAIAGCGFDDLRQRARARKRRRAGASAAAALALLAIVGGFALNAHNSQQSALTEESRTLAARSQQLYAQGDRYGAIETALQALPTSEADTSRPLIPEAQTALEEALQVQPDNTTLWFPSYSLQSQNNIVQIVTSPDAGWFATLEEDLSITVYETLTGRLLSSCQLPFTQPVAADGEIDNWAITAAGDYLIAAERDGSGVLACFNAATGNLNWSIESAIADAITVSGDNRTLDTYYNSGDMLHVAAIDITTGYPINFLEFENHGLPDYPIFLPACIGDDASIFYVGIGSCIGRFDFKQETLKFTDDIPGSVVWSLFYYDNVLLSARSDRVNDDYDSPDFGNAHNTWKAYTGNLDELWEHEGIWRAENIGQAYDLEPVYSWPNIWGIDLASEKYCFLCTAGNAFSALEYNTGVNLHGSKGLSASVVGFGCGYYIDDELFYVIACADGKVEVTTSLSPAISQRNLGFSFPASLQWSDIAWTQNTCYIAIAQSLKDNKQVFVYHMTVLSPEEYETQNTYSLDELVSLAHETLATAGR